MQRIEEIESLNGITEKYSRKGTITNNYLLTDAYQEYIKRGSIYVAAGPSNAAILIKKEGFYRLYYYLNDFGEALRPLPKEPVVLEIIYRGEAKKPIDEMKYWERCGFRKHLTRDNMVASYNQLTLPAADNQHVKISYAGSENEVLFVKDQMNSSLDKYTGDQMSTEELKEAARSRNILIASSEGESAGFLRFYTKNNVVWLGHIVVAPEFRGKGIANELVRAYILDNVNESNTRYQLWVLQENTGAVKLYQKFGFIYANKSSASMLKL
jgi:GNAT superfamily N-acetyltransferase